MEETNLDCSIQDSLDQLPEKSRQKYDRQFELFEEWCSSKSYSYVSESVVMEYLTELSKKFKASTLWAVHSMLKSTLRVKKNVDISGYSKVYAFLKKMSLGQQPKKSRTFTLQDINKFLLEAPNSRHLMEKVVLIIGVAGGCRSTELVAMTMEDISDKGDSLIIKIPNTKYNSSRFFVVRNTIKNGPDTVKICQKYFGMRPPHLKSRRTFFKYVNGKPSAQLVGHHTIGAVPSRIAAYLRLGNAKEYTGHCFRRTYATILTSKHHGMSAMAEDFHSSENKTAVDQKIDQNGVGNQESSSRRNHLGHMAENVVNLPTTSFENTVSFDLRALLNDNSKQGITFTNCTFHGPILFINCNTPDACPKKLMGAVRRKKTSGVNEYGEDVSRQALGFEEVYIPMPSQGCLEFKSEEFYPEEMPTEAENDLDESDSNTNAIPGGGPLTPSSFKTVGPLKTVSDDSNAEPGFHFS